jgi:hypothetical protein
MTNPSPSSYLAGRAKCRPWQLRTSTSARTEPECFPQREILETEIAVARLASYRKVLTGEERTKLVWHLAAMRARKIVEMFAVCARPTRHPAQRVTTGAPRRRVGSLFTTWGCLRSTHATSCAEGNYRRPPPGRVPFHEPGGVVEGDNPISVGAATVRLPVEVSLHFCRCGFIGKPVPLR